MDLVERSLAAIAQVGEVHRNPDGAPWIALRGPTITDETLSDIESTFKFLPDFQLDLTEAAITDAGLRCLTLARGMTNLVLARTKIKGPGLANLRGLAALELLQLDGCTQLTDAGLAGVSGLIQLTCLWLPDVPIGDAGLAHIKVLPRLQRLSLEGTRITDAGLQHLTEIEKLTQLGLGKTSITDLGMGLLARMPRLQSLDLHQTRVRGPGLARLEKCPELRWLDLSETQLTDAAVTPLTNMKQLAELSIRGCQISNAALCALIAALPETEIQSSEMVAKRPAPLQVARRALGLAAMACRATLDRSTHGNAEEFLQTLRTWCRSLGVDRELEPAELAILDLPFGQLSTEHLATAAWRAQGLTILSWALQRSPWPPLEAFVPPPTLLQELGLMQAAGQQLLTEPHLRSLDELQQAERTLFLINWRLHEFVQDHSPIDLRTLAATSGWLDAETLAQVPLQGGDLALGARPLATATTEEVTRLAELAAERLRAMHWILGTEAPS